MRDLEAASFMDMDDFMTGGLPAVPNKRQKVNVNEEQVDDQINERDLHGMNME